MNTIKYIGNSEDICAEITFVLEAFQKGQLNFLECWETLGQLIASLIQNEKQ